jgi:hypothetical protein
MASHEISNSLSPSCSDGENSPRGILARLARRQFQHACIDSQESLHQRVVALPPLEARVALLSAQRNKWKIWCLSTAAVGALCALTLGYFLNHKLFERMGSEFIIVPGAADYIRVRPNLIPDSAVFAFAEYVASHAGTFSYRNAKESFAIIGERMVPELKGRFLRDTDARLTEWSRRRVDQVFAYEPARRLDVLTDDFGAKYALVVKGTRTQYADGTLLQETAENLYLVLRPRLSVKPGTRADESLFQIERLEWVTSSQAETLLATRLRDDSSPSPEKGNSE